MLWHPVLGVAEEARQVVTAKAGLPHCARCDKALSLVTAAQEVWSCAVCGGFIPGKDVDFYAMDTVIAEGLAAFLSAEPSFTPAEGLAPARAALSA
jgi:ribosomal protein L37AE/L43A